MSTLSYTSHDISHYVNYPTLSITSLSMSTLSYTFHNFSLYVNSILHFTFLLTLTHYIITLHYIYTLRLQMELNKAVSLHPHSSAWCSQPCCQMPSATMTCPASRLDSGQMASYLTIGTFMQSPRLERTRCVTSYLQTTAHSMLPQRTTCSRT